MKIEKIRFVTGLSGQGLKDQSVYEVWGLGILRFLIRLCYQNGAADSSERRVACGED